VVEDAISPASPEAYPQYPPSCPHGGIARAQVEAKGSASKLIRQDEGEVMREIIEITDEDGVHQYSNMYRASGENIHITTGGLGSIAGTPKVVNVTVMWPHLVAQNPAKNIDSTKEYDIIIIEREKK